MKLRNSWGLNKVKVVNLVQHTLSKGTGTERYKLSMVSGCVHPTALNAVSLQQIFGKLHYEGD